MAKNIRGFLENLFEYYFLNIIVNVNFFSDLKFEYYCEYYPKVLLQVSLELKFMGGAMKYFPKKLLGHKIFSSMASCTTNSFFWKICTIVQPYAPSPPSYILNVSSLRVNEAFEYENTISNFKYSYYWEKWKIMPDFRDAMNLKGTLR